MLSFAMIIAKIVTTRDLLGDDRLVLDGQMTVNDGEYTSLLLAS